MHATMHLIVGSCENWNVKMITGKYLIWLINYFMPFGVVFLFE